MPSREETILFSVDHTAHHGFFYFPAALSLRFKEPSYTVNEDQRMVNVCIQLIKTSLDDTTIILDDVSDSAVGGIYKA